MDLIGRPIKFKSDESNVFYLPQRDLWVSVLVRAVLDVLREQKKYTYTRTDTTNVVRKNAVDAIGWLRSDDCKTICELCDIDHSLIAKGLDDPQKLLDRLERFRKRPMAERLKEYRLENVYFERSEND